MHLARYLLLLALGALPASGDLPAPPSERVVDATTGAGGRVLAYYLAPQDAGDRRAEGQLVVEGPSGRLSLATPLRLRALLLPDGGATLFAVGHRPSRRGEEGPLYLYRAALDAEPLELERLMRVPPGTADMTLWSEEQALLLATPGQIRSLLLPSLRSGPLFAVAGLNTAVASLGGTSAILIGQPDALLLVELTDRPERDGQPVRERFALESPVVSLRSAPDGRSATAGLADGSTLSISTAPFAVRPGPSGTVVATSSPTPAAPLWPREIPEATEPPLPAPPAPASPAAVTDATPDPPAQARTESAPAVPEAGAAPPPPPAPIPPGVSLRGRVVGPGAHLAVAVVVSGPDNILREAARVPLDADGGWSLSGLAPGRYRIQPDGGGGRVLVSSPPFVTVTLEEGGAIEVPAIEVLRAL